ncbi:MAG: hypothetical protein WBW53_20905 [Terriglobales bacterium]
MNLSGKISALIVCLFALPFAGFGLFALSQALRLIGAGPGSPSFWYPLVFGVVFCGVGFGLIFVVFYGSNLVRRKQRLQVEHPMEPWLCREDWAQGRATSKTRGSMIGAWVFAGIWNLCSTPIVFLLPQAVQQKGPNAYFMLVFPVVGIFLLIRAIRQTMAYFEFGKTYFQMSSVPGVIGSDLQGQIEARFPHSPDHGIHLQLSCVHRFVTGTGKSQTTSEKILWREEADLSSGQLGPGPAGTTIPISFRIPADAQPTEQRNPRDEFVWLLEAIANVPGVNYHDVFEVPVFRTRQCTRPPDGEAFAAEAVESCAAAPANATVEVRQRAEGTEFYFPPARNKSFATSTTVLLLIFGAVTYFVLHHAPIVFPIAFGFFTLLLLYFSTQLWLGTSRVIIGGNVLTLQSGLLGGGKVQLVPCSEIESIRDRIAAQQGGATGTPYYDIELTMRNGKRLTLGQRVREKHETEWLVGEMRKLAGLQVKGMSAGTA